MFHESGTLSALTGHLHFNYSIIPSLTFQLALTLSIVIESKCLGIAVRFNLINFI